MQNNKKQVTLAENIIGEMTHVRIGGVPEHFNLAWHLAIESGIFEKNNIKIDWTDFPGGTGAMCKALAEDRLDIAIALTEGAIKAINDGNPSRIVQFYVNSPLQWGIYVSGKSQITELKQITGLKYAISRFGSGSHLMAIVNARKNNTDLKREDFVLVNDLDGARKALADNDAQLFMWEKFTTKPLVDNGEFRMIGSCDTPWPCFVVMVSNKFAFAHESILGSILEIINASCTRLKSNPEALKLIVERYNISPDDAKEWFENLDYASEAILHEGDLRLILHRLKRYEIIDTIPELNSIIYEKNLLIAEQTIEV